MPMDLFSAMSRRDRPVFGTDAFVDKEPRSPCFLVGDRFFRTYGQRQIFAFLWTGSDKQDIRRFDFKTERGTVMRGFVRRGEHFNIGSITPGVNAFNDMLMTTYMTQEQIDECSRSYIRIPRNTHYGYELQYNHDEKSFGDTFLGSMPKIVKRYPPKELNPHYNKEPLLDKKIPHFAEEMDKDRVKEREERAAKRKSEEKLKEQKENVK